MSGINMESHRQEQLAENARFLLGLGIHVEQVARRLGVTVDQLEQTLRRQP